MTSARHPSWRLLWALTAATCIGPCTIDADAQVLKTADLYPRTRVDAGGVGLPSSVITVDRPVVSLRRGQAVTVVVRLSGSSNAHGRASVGMTPAPPITATFDASGIDVPAGATVATTMTIFAPDDTVLGDYRLAVEARFLELASRVETAYISLAITDSPFRVLPQVSVEAVTGSLDRPALGVEYFEAQFGSSGEGTLSVRSTVTLRSAEAVAAAAPIVPSDDLRRSLLDPKGGWLCASFGWDWNQIGNTRWSFDAGGSARFVEVPETPSSQPPSGSSAVGVVAGGGGHVRFALIGGTPGPHVTLALVGGYNAGWLAPETASTVFSEPLRRFQQGADGGAALWLPAAHLYLYGQFRWVHDPQLGHQTAFGLAWVR
jgi:hypothetical protein